MRGVPRVAREEDRVLCEGSTESHGKGVPHADVEEYR